MTLNKALFVETWDPCVMDAMYGMKVTDMHTGTCVFGSGPSRQALKEKLEKELEEQLKMNKPMDHPCIYCGEEKDFMVAKWFKKDNFSFACIDCDERLVEGSGAQWCKQIKSFPAYHWVFRLKELVKALTKGDKDDVDYEVELALKQLGGDDDQ